MSTILSHWPFESPPRKTQVDVLEWLEQQTAKYLIVESPVGSGKSVIGMTYSRFIDNGRGNSYILTPQRILQDQYVRSFDKEDISPFYGKSNYKCNKNKTSCDIGSLLKKEECRTQCPHKIARTQAVNAHNTVLNYKLALTHFAFLDVLEKRDLLVLDECHVLEEQLVEFDAISVSRMQAEALRLKWKPMQSMSVVRNWLVDSYIPALQSKVDQMEPEVEDLSFRRTLDPDEARFVRDYNKLADHLAEVSEIKFTTLEVLKDTRVLVHDKASIKLKRLSAAKSFNHILKDKADRMLFMSSTILDHKGFCEDLGIPIEETAFISMDSEFPTDNRPVFYMPQMKMNASWKQPERRGELEQHLEVIKQVLGMHENESGIIHTGNFAIAEWLCDNLRDIPHKVYNHNPDSGDNRDDIIKAFQHESPNKPCLLISPSITEGLDLHDDLARFAIFTKIPFGFLGDQWIKARMDRSNAWYRRMALIAVIQGCGRVVRSKEDKGNVYITDQSWKHLYHSSYEWIPQWWRDAYVEL